MQWLQAALTALLLSAHQAHAGCWIVSGLSGHAASKSDGYAWARDGFLIGNPPPKFIVSTDGAGSVSGHNDMKCFAINPSTVACTFQDNVRASVEVWSVDEAAGTGTLVRTRSGYGLFDGIAAFTGKAEACVKPSL